MRQTKATGHASHWWHLVLEMCCYSLYQSVLGLHQPTLLFATATGACQPGRPVLLGESPSTLDAGVSRGAKDYLCLSAIVLCSLGAALTPQSPLSLPGTLTGFLLWMCLKTFNIHFIFCPVWTTQKNLLWPVLWFKFSCQRLFYFLCFSRVWKDFCGVIMLG